MHSGLEKTLNNATREIIQNRIFQVTVTGGEPLAVYEHILPHLEMLNAEGISVSLNSNLTMLTEKKARELKVVGVRSILTSLMAGNPGLNDELANRPNTHRDVSRGIRIALEEGHWVGVNMVVTKRNLEFIYDTAEYIKSLGVTSFSATKASIPARDIDFSKYLLSPDDFNFMLNELIRVRDELGLSVDSLEFYPLCSYSSQEQVDSFGGRICNAGKTACTIGFDGKVRPCSHSVQIYGSIDSERGRLKEAWLNMNEWRTSSLIPEVCRECAISTICRGGCRTEAFVHFGSLNSPDPYSNYEKLPLRRSPSKPFEVNSESKFIFHPNLRRREEDFGGILFLTPRKWVPVDHNLYKFYESGINIEFNLKVLAGALGVEPDEAVPTAGTLLRKEIILERR